MGNDRRKSQANYRTGGNNISFHKKEFKSKAKEGFVLVKGIVIEAYPNTRFLVKLDNNDVNINVTLAGKLRQNFIKILAGDRVELELSIYDLTSGRIVRRL